MALKFPPKDLLFARAYNFAFMGGWGFVLPFVNLFYISIGLSGTQIGTIASLSAIVGLVVSPVVVTEIKKLPQARTILQLCLVLGGMGYFLLVQQTVFIAILVIVFFHTFWKTCIFSFCGVLEFHRRMFSVVVTSTEEERRGWLDEVREMVNTLFPVVAQ